MEACTYRLTETAEFRAWFRGSKVVDLKGQPLVVYHGTKTSFQEFKPKSRNPDIGFHFGDVTQAENFAGFNAYDLTTSGGNIVPAYLVSICRGSYRCWHLCWCGVRKDGWQWMAQASQGFQEERL